jgi:hypothetical protein
VRHLRAALLTLLLAVVAGCGAVGAVAPHPVVPETVSAGPVSPLPAAEPAALHIEAIGATSTLIPLGLNADDTVEVPPIGDPMQAGWYRYGPTPGERGPAVVLGHVNGNGEDGIFADLDELTTGDQIIVTRDDGRTAVFTVTRTARVPKTAFPTESVYGDTEGAELRLITCGGTFDESRDSYRDNIIVYAVLAEIR